jgi:hypothetical protein
LVATLHDRMPVVLTPPAMLRWLGDTPLSDSAIHELCQPILEVRHPRYEMYATPTLAPSKLLGVLRVECPDAYFQVIIIEKSYSHFK